MNAGWRTCGSLLLATTMASAQAFEVSSPDIGPDKPFAENFLFNGLGCKGGNVSPAVAWANPPQGTKSFALMVHDDDAITGGAGIWHWVVINIPGSARGFERGAGTPDGANLPAGSREVANDYAGFGVSPGWGGPCPPKGDATHHYRFTVYALGVDQIDLPAAATASHAGFLINRMAIGKAELTAPYQR